MKLSEKILEDWGDVSETQKALAKDVLIEQLELMLKLRSVACLTLYVEWKLKKLKDE